MMKLDVKFAGVERPVFVPGSLAEAELQALRLMREPGIVAVDTETTGLDIYAPGFAVRLVQFGTTEYAVVFDAARFASVIGVLVGDEGLQRMVMHNAAFDIKVLTHAGGWSDIDSLWGRTVDTQLISHLIDPRGKQDGGTGHSLKGLAAAYVDDEAFATQKALHTWAAELGLDKDSFWSEVPINNLEYLEYAGADVILTSWVLEALRPLMVAGGFTKLSAYEHELARVCTHIEDTGLLVDVAYLVDELGPALEAREVAGSATALDFGVDNVNSTQKLAKAFDALGVPMEHKTAKGNVRVDSEVLEGIVGRGGGAGRLAEAVIDAKKSGSFKTKYVDKVVERVDERGRVHPHLMSLRARTARMAVSDPPLHQLPAQDHLIRSAFIAPPGCVIGATDSDQVELRVLAALSEDRVMREAIASGVDLHSLTAEAAGVERRIGKMANFLIVYGGGAGKLARSAGIEMSVAKKVLDSFWKTYPGVRRYRNLLVERCERGQRDLITPTGRRLIMDRDKSYAALNHMIQSTARDVLGMAVVLADEVGLTGNMLMLVHDEVVWQAAEDSAEEVARLFKECLTFEDFLGSGVTLSAGSQVYGKSWGAGYVRSA